MIDLDKEREAFEAGEKVVLIDRRTSGVILSYVAESNWRPKTSLLSCGDGVLYPYFNTQFRRASGQEQQENRRIDSIELDGLKHD